jgi:hypothetical protein
MWMWVFSAGLFNLALAGFHLFFWRLFRWPHELPKLGFANRGIMQILNLCLIFFFVLMGGIFLVSPNEVAGIGLGRSLLLGMTVFWLVRTVYQPMFFGLRHPLSAGLFGVFILGALLHGMAWWRARGI